MLGSAAGESSSGTFDLESAEGKSEGRTTESWAKTLARNPAIKNKIKNETRPIGGKLISDRDSSISPLLKIQNKITEPLNTPLPEQLATQIRKSGPIPFHDFMEQALYHPDYGFYTSGNHRTGKKGDFMTPVSAGPVLGELLARQIHEFDQALQQPPTIRLVEQGADQGWLACDVLTAMRRQHPDLFPRVKLHLIEPFPRLKKTQGVCLEAAEFKNNVQWHSSWSTMPRDDTATFFYSCELVDSFPVRIFCYRNGAWREQCVGLGGTGFIWQEDGIDVETAAMIRHWSPPEVEGFTVEIRPGTTPWLEGWARRISQGLVLTLDYGYSAMELFSPARAGGTLVAMRDHQRSTHPLAEPGQQDLTAHVNFTELEESAAREGWKNYGLVDFARGCTALAAPLLREDKKPSDPWIRNFRHLTHPTLFGQTHKILVQGKGLPETFQPAMLRKI